MLKKKYEMLEDDSMKLGDGTVLYRIKALRNFGDVKKGDIGGYIEKESNLSHDGTCWVYDEADVKGNARVLDHAKVRDLATVEGYSVVSDFAEVFENAIIRKGVVSDYAKVFGEAIIESEHGGGVRGSAWVYGNAKIYGPLVEEKAEIFGFVRLVGFRTIGGRVKISGNFTLDGDFTEY